MLAEKLEPLYAAEAKIRQREHGNTAPGKKSLEQKIAQAKKRFAQARDMAAKATKTNRQYVSDVKKIKNEAPELYARMEAGKVELREAKQEIKEQKKATVVEQIKQEPKPLPDGPFRVQAIDPPWQYEARAADTTHRARNPYPDMTLDAIKALPVGEKAHPDGWRLKRPEPMRKLKSWPSRHFFWLSFIHRAKFFIRVSKAGLKSCRWPPA